MREEELECDMQYEETQDWFAGRSDGREQQEKEEEWWFYQDEKNQKVEKVIK